MKWETVNTCFFSALGFHRFDSARENRRCSFLSTSSESSIDASLSLSTVVFPQCTVIRELFFLTFFKVSTQHNCIYYIDNDEKPGFFQ